MSDSNEARNPGATWLIAIVAAFIVLASILAGLFLLRNTDEAATAEVQMTPITGGTIAPTTTPVVAETAKEMEMDVKTPGKRVFTAAVLSVGAQVTAASLDGAGVRVRNDASSDAQVLDVYQDGAKFTILEPSGEYTEFPVEQNGEQWVRVRTADGLVGWAVVDELAPTE